MPIDAYRGAGKPEANYLTERLIDRAAREMHLDPFEIRRRNLIGGREFAPLVLYDDKVPGEAERAEEVSGAILSTYIEYGGSITGEHGVGVDKSRYMPKMFTSDDLAPIRLRCAFDPASLCNPGKIFPTPRLCGEVPGHRRAPHPAVVSGKAEIFSCSYKTARSLPSPDLSAACESVARARRRTRRVASFPRSSPRRRRTAEAVGTAAGGGRGRPGSGAARRRDRAGLGRPAVTLRPGCGHVA